MTSSRRQFLKTAALASAWALPGVRAALAQAPAGRRPPNVLLILTDDQGAVDAGCWGIGDIATPSIDALAKRGTRFTQFYVTSASCSPSRASLLTGCYPQRVGVASNVSGERGLDPEKVTLAEMLRARGYRTALFGKWHLGLLPEKSPNAQGFDEFFGHKEGCIDNYSHYYHWGGANRHDLWKDGREHWENGAYFPDLCVREARRFIRENRERPFFLYLPFNLPHFPMQGDEAFRARYAALPPARREYAISLATLDQKIGEVMAALDAEKLRDDTIVLFLSDNGHSASDRNFGGGGSAGPWRGCKTQFWEGGIRMPCIVSWPGHVPENETRGQLATGLDWFPTLAAWCGAAKPGYPLDGVSLAPILESAKAPDAHAVMHWQYGKQWAVRKGDWKLLASVFRGDVPFGRPKEVETPLALVNLKDDPGEMKDLSAARPEIVAELTALHEAWAREVAPPTPSPPAE